MTHVVRADPTLSISCWLIYCATRVLYVLIYRVPVLLISATLFILLICASLFFAMCCRGGAARERVAISVFVPCPTDPEAGQTFRVACWTLSFLGWDPSTICLLFKPLAALGMLCFLHVHSNIPWQRSSRLYFSNMMALGALLIHTLLEISRCPHANVVSRI